MNKEKLRLTSCSETSGPHGKTKVGDGRYGVCRGGSEAVSVTGIDLFSREVISQVVSDRPKMYMVSTVLEKVLYTLSPGATPVLHSELGWQYLTQDWQT